MQQVIFNPGDRVKISTWENMCTIIDSSGPMKTYRTLAREVCYRVDGQDYELNTNPNNCHSMTYEEFLKELQEHIPFRKDYDPEQQPYTDEDI